MDYCCSARQQAGKAVNAFRAINEKQFLTLKLFLMKKLKLSALHGSGIEVLTREQMKNVLGKMIGGSDSGDWGGCQIHYGGCGGNSEGVITCDYYFTDCPSGFREPLCYAQCINPSDGDECRNYPNG
jgi:hypothetical protein